MIKWINKKWLFLIFKFLLNFTILPADKNIIKTVKKLDGVLGIQTRGCRIKVANKSTELGMAALTTAFITITF